MALYILCAYIAAYFRDERPRYWRDGRNGRPSLGKKLMTRVFDGATFSASTMLLLGITDSHLLSLIGNTKPFLVIGGAVGFLYGLHAIFAGD